MSVTCEAWADVTGIQLNKSSVKLVGGDTEIFVATVIPDNTSNKTVTWSSDKEDVATVDDKGKVTAVGIGTANITATATNGTDDVADDKTTFCTVNVVNVTAEIVTARINALPAPSEVTSTDKTAIERARELYELLDDTEKVKVTDETLAKLIAVETALAIAKLPVASATNVSHESAVEAARTFYDNLSNEQKEQLGATALAKLEAVEVALAIVKLPVSTNLTSADKDAVVAVRTVYDKLTEEQKTQVGAIYLAKLEEAEAVLEAYWDNGINYATPEGGKTFDATIIVNGAVRLTLTDGETLIANKGISLADGAILTVDGSGTMVVNGTNGNTLSTTAGTGELILKSGMLTVIGGKGADGEKYGRDGAAGGTAVNGAVTVSGGTLTAIGGTGGNLSGDGIFVSKGGNGGAAIGGALTINGGILKATVGAGGNSSGSEHFDSSPGIGGASYAGTLTLGTGVKLYEGIDSTGTILNDNDDIIREYSGEKKTSMYASGPDVVPHTHRFIYTLLEDGGTISAICHGKAENEDLECSLKNITATLTISSPPESNLGVGAQITDEYNISGGATVSYYKVDENGNKTGDVLAGAPTEVGKYWAEITLGEGDNAATAHVVYEIAPVVSIGDISYTTLQDAIDNVNDGDIIKLLSDIKGCFTFNKSGKTITLDLNGHTIDGNQNNTVITINSGTLILEDTSEAKTGSITGGKQGVAVNNAGSTFKMKAGTIEKNKGTINGAGVSVNNDATFEMMGGTIQYNETTTYTAGVLLYERANFIMSGGTIQYNIGANGGFGGIGSAGAKVKLSGTPVIKDNTLADGTACDVRNTKNAEGMIEIVGKLENGARIGVYNYMGDKSITTGYNTYNQDSEAKAFFFSNDSSKTIKKNSDGELIFADFGAEDVIAMIEELPEAENVTPEDKDEIEAARAAYDALTDGQKEGVTNYSKLTDAEAALRTAEEKEAADTAAANAVINLINGLKDADEVTTDDESDIKTARNAYDALTDDQKAKISAETLKKLTDDELALEAAKKEAADIAAANDVINKIDDIPAKDDITTESKALIEAARTAYDKLTDDQKGKIPEEKLQKLIEAESTLAAKEAEKAAKELADAKTDAKAALDNLKGSKNESDYDEEDWSALNSIIEEGKSAIDGASDKDSVNNAKTGAESEVAKIKTKEQKAQEALAAAKESAKTELDNLLRGKQSEDYYEEDWSQLESIISEAKDAIDAASDTDTVESTKNDAIAGVGEIKNKAERDAETLQEAKDAAKAELDNLLGSKDEEDYDSEDWENIKNAIETAKSAIDEAEDTDTVTQVKNQAVDTVAATKTTSQKEQEALEAAKTEATNELDNLLAQKNNSDYDEADWAALTAAIEEGKQAVAEASNKEDVENAKNGATGKVSEIKTIAQKTAEKEAADTEAADSASKKILALASNENIKSSDRAAIEEARAAYDALTDDQKAKVSTDTLNKLTEAEEALAKAEADEAAANAVSDKINALKDTDEITTSDKEAIEAARNAYDGLTDDQKKKVSADTLNKLTNAEKALAKEEADTAAAKNVTDQIDELKDSNKVTTSDKSAIEAARKAYNALTNDQKEKVSEDTLKKLTDVEAALRRAQEAARRAQEESERQRNNSSDSSSNNNQRSWIDPYRDILYTAGVNGKVETVYFRGNFGLPYEFMDYLQKHPQVTLVYDCTYQGTTSRITLPGSAVTATSNIPVYGPAYLLSVYGGNTAAVGTPVATSATTGNARLYVVQKGDTLSRIANRLHTTVDNLVRRNGIRNRNLIYVNQRLYY